MAVAAQTFASSNQLPDKVGRFEVIRCLGKGAQGVVYLARDPELDRQVAIKTLDKRRRNHKHLLQEARNVSKLEYLNIILKDYALTTKLLRLVNTSYYGQFGGEITTKLTKSCAA